VGDRLSREPKEMGTDENTGKKKYMFLKLDARDIFCFMFFFFSIRVQVGPTKQ
jgi:hypothetical protein